MASDTTTSPFQVSKVFASAPDETRVRRTVDWVLLVGMTIVLALAGWADHEPGDLSIWVDDIVDGAPEWVLSMSTAVFVSSGLVVIGMLVLVARQSRWALVRDALAAAIVVIASSTVLARWVSGEWPDLFPELVESERPAFPVVRIALAVAVLVTIRPSLTAPMRRFERWVIGLTVLSALILGHATLTTAIGGLVLGIGSAAAVRLIFGTSNGVPTVDRVRAALADLGVKADDIVYDPLHRMGSLGATGRDREGTISIRIYGRDAADSAFVNRVWRLMWYRDAEWSIGVSRQQLAEHEALLLLLARRAGVTAPEVVAVGATSTGDVVLVPRPGDERLALADVPGADIDDRLLDRLWATLSELHGAGLSHGRIDPTSVTVEPTASGGYEAAGFVDLAGGQMSPDPLERRIDQLELLVTTALLVGSERAVDAAVRNLGTESMTDLLPTVQPAALSRELSAQVRESDIDVDDLRKATASALEVDAPEPVKLRRVRIRDVLMLLLALVAANALIGWITSIDLDTLVDELADASVGWLLVALVVSQLTNVAETISMMGVVTRPLPFGPTMQFQYATSYIGLAVPSDAGRIAMTIRYLQKLGVPTRIAAGQGPFTTVFGYIIDAILLLVTMRVIGTSLELPEDADFSGFVTILTIVVVLVVVGVVAVVAVPTLRRRILPAVKETVLELKGSLTDPSRAAKLLGGLFAKKLLFALTMASILAAFGQPLPIATVIFVNTAVSWFAGVFPVPGGIGVAEAGFVVGLTAFGVSEPVALATALTHRLLTTYLPPVVGFFMMKRLERQGYL